MILQRVWVLFCFSCIVIFPNGDATASPKSSGSIFFKCPGQPGLSEVLLAGGLGAKKRTVLL